MAPSSAKTFTASLAMLLCLPRYAKELDAAVQSRRVTPPLQGGCSVQSLGGDADESVWKGIPVHVKGATTECQWALPLGPICLYVSEYNPGAWEVAEPLEEGYGRRGKRNDICRTRALTQFYQRSKRQKFGYEIWI